MSSCVLVCTRAWWPWARHARIVMGTAMGADMLCDGCAHLLTGIQRELRCMLCRA